MIQVLIENPLLLLFITAAVGYPLGRIKIAGTNLGVAAVLFTGLAIGALHPDLRLPEIVYMLGLVLFVYTIGLSSGSIFFAALRRKGLRDNLLVGSAIFLAAGLAALAKVFFNLEAPTAAGLYAGALTNTPALAGVLEHISVTRPPGSLDAMLSEPVVAFSLTYPMGVIAMILVITVLQRVWKVNYAQEAGQMRHLGVTGEPLFNQTIQVTQEAVTHQPVKDLVRKFQWNVIIGRTRHDGKVSLATGQTRLEPGDLINLIGPRTALDEATQAMGIVSPEQLEQDLSKYDKRRFFISNVKVAGRRLQDLDLFNRYEATATRIRRGDVELLPHGETKLQLGDQVRVVAPYEKMDDLAHLFGDSYRSISEIDILTFGMGLTLGLLLGLVPIPLPNGITLRLGLAGGPLIVALILGAIGRTGPMVWNLSYGANITLRQLGLVLFLAGIGTRSGYAFISTLVEGSGLAIFLAGTLITFVTALGTLWVGFRWLKIPMGLLIGMLAGLQTQPAILGFALEQTENDLPNVGYATVFPVAMVGKILLAQVLLVVLR